MKPDSAVSAVFPKKKSRSLFAVVLIVLCAWSGTAWAQIGIIGKFEKAMNQGEDKTNNAPAPPEAPSQPDTTTYSVVPPPPPAPEIPPMPVEPKKDPFYPGKTLSQFTDPETGNTISLVRMPDGSVKVVEKNKWGTTVSTKKLSKEEADKLLSGKDGNTAEITRDEDGNLHIAEYDEDGNLLSDNTVEEGSLASASSYDSETGLTTTSTMNPDGSRTITKTDPDGFVVDEETVPAHQLAQASSYDPETGITTTSVKNPDGSHTITRTDKDGNVVGKDKFSSAEVGVSQMSSYDPDTGQTTTALENPDGSKTTIRSKTTTDPDGTVHTTSMADNGSTTETTMNPDGTMTTVKKDPYNTTVTTTVDKDGTMKVVEETATGYETVTTKTKDGEVTTVKKDLYGNTEKTVKQYPDGHKVTTDRRGNTVETTAPDEDGQVTVVAKDRYGNTTTLVKNKDGDVVSRKEDIKVPKDPGREYYETVLHGTDWDDLPKSSKTRYANHERDMRETAQMQELRDEQAAEDERARQEDLEWKKKQMAETDKKLAAIKKEQEEADKAAAERKAKYARKKELEDCYDHAQKLQDEYDEAVKSGDMKKAARIMKEQDEYHEKSMDILAFTPEEEKAMEEKQALRTKLFNEINGKATRLANMDIAENEKYADVTDKAKEIGSALSVGADIQVQVAESNRREERLLAKTKHKDELIAERLKDPNLTPDERDILISFQDLSDVQTEGALEQKAANNRLVAAGYAIDGAMLISGGVANIAVETGAKVAGKAAAMTVARQAVSESLARGIGESAARKVATEVGEAAGEKVAKKILNTAYYDVTEAATRKAAEKIAARQAVKDVFAQKIEQGFSQEAAEKAAQEAGAQYGKEAGKTAVKELKERGLLSYLGSKAGGKTAEKVFGEETGKAVETALAKKRSIIPEPVKKMFSKSSAEKTAETSAKALGEETARTQVGKTTAEPTASSPTVRMTEAEARGATSPTVRMTEAEARGATSPTVRMTEAEARGATSPTVRMTEAEARGATSPTVRMTEAEARGATSPTVRMTEAEARGATSPTVRLTEAEARGAHAPTVRTVEPAKTVDPGGTTILDNPLKGGAERGSSAEVSRTEIIDKTERMPAPSEKHYDYPRDKKPTEMTMEERQAYQDAISSEAVRGKRNAVFEDDESLLPESETAVQPPEEGFTRALTQKEKEELFEGGISKELTGEDVIKKVDLMRRGEVPESVSNFPKVHELPEGHPLRPPATDHEFWDNYVKKVIDKQIAKEELEKQLAAEEAKEVKNVPPNFYDSSVGTVTDAPAAAYDSSVGTVTERPATGGRSGKGGTQVLSKAEMRGGTQALKEEEILDVLRSADTVIDGAGPGGTQILDKEELEKLSWGQYDDADIEYGNRKMAEKELKEFAKNPKKRTEPIEGKIDELPRRVPSRSNRRADFVRARSAWKRLPPAERARFDQAVRDAIDEAAAMGNKWAKRLQNELNNGTFDYVYEPGLKYKGLAPKGEPVQLNPFGGRGTQLGSADEAASTLLHEYVHAYKGPETFKAAEGLPHTGPSTKGEYNEVRAFWAETQFNRDLKLARGLNGKDFDPTVLNELEGLMGIDSLPDKTLSGQKTVSTTRNGLKARRNLQEGLVDDYYGEDYAHSRSLAAERLSTYKGGSMEGIRQRLDALRGPNGESTPEYEALLEEIRREGGRVLPK